jgi:hypothetical protein
MMLWNPAAQVSKTHFMRHPRVCITPDIPFPGGATWRRSGLSGEPYQTIELLFQVMKASHSRGLRTTALLMAFGTYGNRYHLVFLC